MYFKNFKKSLRCDNHKVGETKIIKLQGRVSASFLSVHQPFFDGLTKMCMSFNPQGATFSSADTCFGHDSVVLN